MGGRISKRRRFVREPREKSSASGEEGGERECAKGEFKELVRESAAFEAYYRAVGLVEGEEEFAEMLSTLQRDLPATFRVTGHRAEVDALRARLLDGTLRAEWEAGAPSEGGGEAAESALPAVTPLPWYHPRGSAWQIDGGRRAVRKDAACARLHRWLQAATENGDLSRQEAVSMVPPLLLGAGADDRILDMCAAPGSKTAQLVEQMHAAAAPLGRAPTGVVVANDADRNRSFMLYHQVRRILSPSLTVTNMDASAFPALRLGPGADGRFDRILADVPCSGDGTLRKNPAAWRRWTPHAALGIHPLQLRILQRGLELLRPGGRLVYSTCSLNPIENEAVVAAAITRFAGAIRTVDVADQLPELRRRGGRASWPVVLADGTRYDTYEQAAAATRDEDGRPIRAARRLPPSLFAHPEYAGIGLEHCLEIHPHLQDTGGFFVAVLERVREDNVEVVPTPDAAHAADPESEPVNEASDAPAPTEPERPRDHRGRPGFVREGEALRLVPFTESAVQEALRFYDIDVDALSSAGYALTTRSAAGEEDSSSWKTVNIVAKHAVPFVEQSGFRGRGAIRLVNAGVRLLELYVPSKRAIDVEKPASLYRLLSESLSVLLPFFRSTKRIAAVSVDDLRSLLLSQDTLMLPRVASQLQGVPGGAVVYPRFAPLQDDAEIIPDIKEASASPLAIPVWLVFGDRVKAFLPNANRPAYLMALKDLSSQTHSAASSIQE